MNRSPGSHEEGWTAGVSLVGMGLKVFEQDVII